MQQAAYSGGCRLPWIEGSGTRNAAGPRTPRSSQQSMVLDRTDGILDRCLLPLPLSPRPNGAAFALPARLHLARPRPPTVVHA